MENLEELLVQANMNKFLDDLYSGVPEEYKFPLFDGLLMTGLSHGFAHMQPIKNFALNIRSGEEPAPEEKNKIIECAKKLYSFGYSVALDALDKLKLKNDWAKLDDCMNVIHNSFEILSNVVCYFNPEGVESYRNSSMEGIKRIFEEAFYSGQVKIDRKDII